MSYHTSSIIYAIAIPFVSAAFVWYVRGKQRNKLRKKWAQRFRDEGFSEDEVEALIPYAIYTNRRLLRVLLAIVGLATVFVLLSFLEAILGASETPALFFGIGLVLLAGFGYPLFRRYSRTKTVRRMLENRPRDLIEGGESALGFSIDVDEYSAPNPDVQAETNGAVSKKVYDTSDGSVVYFSVSDPEDVDVVEQDEKLELVDDDSQVVGTVDLSRFSLGDVEYKDDEILVHISRAIGEN